MLLAGSTRFLSLEVSRGGRPAAAKQQPPPLPTQWRQRAPYAFVSRVSRVYRAGVRTLLGSHTGSPGAREPPHRRLRTPRARRTQKAAQSQDRPASASLRPHGPTHPHKQQFPDPSAQFPVALFGHFPRRAAAKAGRRARARSQPVQAGKHTHTPRQALPSQQPSGRKVGQQSKQARTRARPAHHARPLLNRWLPTHSFPQRVAARTYSTSPAQAHALVGCTASHRPRHTNERPRAQAVRTIPAEAGSARQRIGVSFPCDKRRGTRPPNPTPGRSPRPRAKHGNVELAPWPHWNLRLGCPDADSASTGPQAPFGQNPRSYPPCPTDCRMIYLRFMVDSSAYIWKNTPWPGLPGLAVHNYKIFGR